MTDRAAAPRPGYARCGFGWCQRGVHVMPGCHRQARGSQLPQRGPGLSRCTCAASAACPLPLLKRPKLTVCGFIYRRFRPRITAGYICGKRSAYLCVIAAWRVDSFAFFSVHRAWIALSQVEALLRARPGNTIPSISPMCAQARRRFTQVIHMVMHSKACNTFSCRLAGSVPVGRCLREAAGTQDADLAWAWMTSPPTASTGCSPHTLQDRRPRVPSRRPAVTLTVIPSAARPRYAQAARTPSPPALALRLRHHGHEPQREAPVPNRRPGSVADHRPATAAAGALALPEASPLATARHPVLRARTLAVLHGSVAGAAALTITASGPARRPEDARPARPDPRSSRPAFRSCRRCRTRQSVPAGQNQARPLHV